MSTKKTLYIKLVKTYVYFLFEPFFLTTDVIVLNIYKIILYIQFVLYL